MKKLLLFSLLFLPLFTQAADAYIPEADELADQIDDLELMEIRNQAAEEAAALVEELAIQEERAGSLSLPLLLEKQDKEARADAERKKSSFYQRMPQARRGDTDFDTLYNQAQWGKRLYGTTLDKDGNRIPSAAGARFSKFVNAADRRQLQKRAASVPLPELSKMVDKEISQFKRNPTPEQKDRVVAVTAVAKLRKTPPSEEEREQEESEPVDEKACY